jgi:putative ABC transport system ATP-binding protein
MELLQVTDLKKSYVSPDGERVAIVDVPRLSLASGEQLALQGPSGSGKTTLLNLIAGILKPDAGEILISGRNICGLSESLRDRLRSCEIGYIFQTFNLLQGYTALGNVELSMLLGRGRGRVPGLARLLLERVGLGPRLRYRPRELSVGQQQRVAVARALANHPALVLADEPTGNLDQAHAVAAIDLIREICGENNAALLLVSHDPAVLGRFEQVRPLSEINHAAA